MAKYIGKYTDESALMNAVISGSLSKPYVALAGQVVNYNEYGDTVIFDSNGNTAATVDAFATSIVLDIYAPEWALSSSGEWASLSVASGVGSGNCVVTFSENIETGGAERSSVITLSYTLGGESLTKIFNLTQEYGSLASMPVTLDIVSAGTIGLSNSISNPKTIQYKLNDGEWTTWTGSLDVSVGDTVQLKDTLTGTNSTLTFTDGGARYNMKGNILSLYDAENYATLTAVTSSSTGCIVPHFAGGPIDAENLYFPDVKLGPSAFNGMFNYSTTLVKAPKELKSQSLAYRCYYQMFKNCSNLTTTPILAATDVAGQAAYYDMFNACTSLTEAAEISATAITGSEACRGMFFQCANLAYVKCLAKSITGTSAMNDWLYGVASRGTFVKSPDMSSWSTGTAGIPNNWTVIDA